MEVGVVMAAVKIGTRFHAVVADGNPLWEVTRKLGRGVWEATVVNEPIEVRGVTFDSDYAGITRAYRTREIVASIEYEAAWKRMLQTHEDYYAGLELGSVVHYHNSFGQFVRCKVVDGVDKDGVEGRMLHPIALVGPWRSYDLGPDAYYPRMIAEDRLLKPNASTVYENPDASVTKSETDPREMEAINLTGEQLSLAMG
jgi:hypothetical protein